MRTLGTRLLADQRTRFLLVGGTNTAVGWLTFAALTLWVFDDLRLGYLLSLVLSYAVAIVLAFVLYRRFVFQVRGHVVRDFARFVQVYLVAICVNAVFLPFLVEVVGLPPIAAQAMTLVITTVMSFVGHQGYSFRRDEVEP